MTATGGLASVVLGRSGDLVNAPMTVEGYIRDFDLRLDARRFFETREGEGEVVLYGQHGEKRLTWERAWCELRSLANVREEGTKFWVCYPKFPWA